MRSYICILVAAVVGCTEPKMVPPEVVVQIGHTNRLTNCVVSPNGKYLLTEATPSGSGTRSEVILWNAVTGEKLRSYRSTKCRFAPQFALTGQAVVCGSRVFHRNTGRTQLTLAEPNRRLMIRKIVRDGEVIVFADDTGLVRAVDLSDGGELARWYLGDWFADGSAGAVERVNGRTGEQNVILDATLNSSGELVGLVMEKSAGADHKSLVAFWNMSHRRKVCEIPVDIIDGAYLSPNAQYLLTRYWDDTGSPDEQLRIFDVRDCRKLVDRREYHSSAANLLFLNDGHTCVVGTGTETLHLLNLQTADVTRQFELHAPAIALRLQSKGIIEAETEDGMVRWETLSGRRLPELKLPSSTVSVPRDSDRSFDGVLPVTPIRIFETANCFVGSAGPETYLCNLQSGQVLANLATQRDDRFRLQFSNDGRRALIQTRSAWRLWDVEHGRLLQTFGYRPRRNVLFGGPAVSFSENGEFVCTHQRRGSVWNSSDGSPVPQNPSDLNRPVDQRPLNWADNEFAFRERGSGYGAFHGTSLLSADHKWLASWVPRNDIDQHSIVVWDLNAGRIAQRLMCPNTELSTRASFSPDGRYFSISDLSKMRLVVWDLDNGEMLTTFDYGGRMTFGVDRNTEATFLNDGKRLVFNSEHRTLTLADVRSGEPIHIMRDKTVLPAGQEPSTVAHDMLLSPDNRYAAVDYGSDYCIVWDLERGRQAIRINRSTGSISPRERLRFSKDSRQLLDPDNTGVHVWDLITGEEHVVAHSKWLYGGVDGLMPRQRAEFDNLTNYPMATSEAWAGLLPDTGLSARVTRNGERLIVQENRRTWSIWNTTDKKFLARCYRFQFGQEWLSVNSRGEWTGASHRVRLRTPHTIDVWKPQPGLNQFQAWSAATNQ